MTTKKNYYWKHSNFKIMALNWYKYIVMIYPIFIFTMSLINIVFCYNYINCWNQQSDHQIYLFLHILIFYYYKNQSETIEPSILGYFGTRNSFSGPITIIGSQFWNLRTSTIHKLWPFVNETIKTIKLLPENVKKIFALLYIKDKNIFFFIIFVTLINL